VGGKFLGGVRGALLNASSEVSRCDVVTDQGNSEHLRGVLEECGRS
jgi:hypothetical protein